MPHDDKQFLNLAGEFYVAAELSRRKIVSSITYGSSKKADIFAFSDDKEKLALIEVKASNKKKWPLGEKVLNRNLWKPRSFWILVDLSSQPPHPPNFYIFTATELGKLVETGHVAYAERYHKKHGKQYEGLNVPNIRLKDISIFQDRWDIINSYLK